MSNPTFILAYRAAAPLDDKELRNILSWPLQRHGRDLKTPTAVCVLHVMGTRYVFLV